MINFEQQLISSIVLILEILEKQIEKYHLISSKIAKSLLFQNRKSRLLYFDE